MRFLCYTTEEEDIIRITSEDLTFSKTERYVEGFKGFKLLFFSVARG